MSVLYTVLMTVDFTAFDLTLVGELLARDAISGASDTLIGLVAQSDAVAETAAGGADATGDGATGTGAAAPKLNFFQQMLSNPMFLIVGMFVILYLTMLAPERRRKAEEAKKMSALQKNDRVITIGGIHGVIVSASPESDVITLRIDEGGNTRVKVNRTAIATVVNPDEEKDKQSDSKAKD